jgi:parvulin-like peptidyl-prolyl isomerase
MLSKMRSRVRIIMWVVAITFIAGFLMGELWRMIGTRRNRGQQVHTTAGQVGKHVITPEEYRSAVTYITDKYKTENRLRDLSNEDYANIERQAWQFLVSELTWAKVLKDASIRVTQDEVFEIMKANPPEELRNNPQLFTDGKFDPQKYVQLMNAPENRQYFAKYFQDMYEMLPKEKFRIDVLASYRVTNGEIQDAMADANAQFRATSLFFGPRLAQGDTAQPTDKELRAYFDSHKEDFKAKEIRQISYVLFPLSLSAQDSADAQATIQRAYGELNSGSEFNLAVLDYSDLEGETLSTMIPRSKLDKATDSIVARLKAGTSSAPFLSQYGWQIVRLDSARTDSIAMRRILVRIKQGGDIVAAIRDSVRGFVEKTRTVKFDTLATEFGLPVMRARPMVGGEPNFAGLQLDGPMQLAEWAKRARKGDVTESPVRGPQGYFVFHMTDVKPAGYQEFDKAKPAVAWKLRQEREKKVWLAKAEQANAEIKAGKTLEQYAAENPAVDIATDSFVGITDCRRRKGAEFAGAAAALKPGERYGVVVANWGAFILRCDARSEAPALTADQYAGQRRQQEAQRLMQEYLKEPEIKDYRNGLDY